MIRKAQATVILVLAVMVRIRRLVLEVMVLELRKLILVHKALKTLVLQGVLVMSRESIRLRRPVVLWQKQINLRMRTKGPTLLG